VTLDPELDVTAEELHYIERLAPRLERSPRALKRFANVSRLLKASLPPEEQDAFLDQSTDPAAFVSPATMTSGFSRTVGLPHFLH
jgi:hypothetical protein